MGQEDKLKESQAISLQSKKKSGKDSAGFYFWYQPCCISENLERKVETALGCSTGKEFNIRDKRFTKPVDPVLGCMWMWRCVCACVSVCLSLSSCFSLFIQYVHGTQRAAR